LCFTFSHFWPLWGTFRVNDFRPFSALIAPTSSS
jgi:hypothetical protein